MISTKWVAFEQFGSYFRLDEGILMQNAMLENGEMDNNPCEVEYIDKDMANVIMELEEIKNNNYEEI